MLACSLSSRAVSFLCLLLLVHSVVCPLRHKRFPSFPLPNSLSSLSIHTCSVRLTQPPNPVQPVPQVWLLPTVPLPPKPTLGIKLCFPAARRPWAPKIPLEQKAPKQSLMPSVGL